MRIAVLGLGHVGAVTAACLADDGHAVTGVDVDGTRVALLAAGKGPVVEPGLDALVARGVQSGHLRASGDAAEAVASAEASLICVGTPELPDGRVDLGDVERVAEQIGHGLRRARRGHLVVMRSTLPPGATRSVLIPCLEESSGLRAGEDFAVCANPEFLREATAIADFRQPPFTVLGGDDADAGRRAAVIFAAVRAPLLLPSLEVAELLKYACNAFHALKISFANEIACLAGALGIDGAEVMSLLGSDRQLNASSAYLRPGFAFGGPCLPKDLRALAALARDRGMEAGLLSATIAGNRATAERALQSVLAHAPRTVGLIGVAFKPGTDDMRESPFAALAQGLIEHGVDVRIYDPWLVPEGLSGANRAAALDSLPDLESRLQPSLAALVACSDLLVVAHDTAGLDALPGLRRAGQAVIDLAGSPRLQRPPRGTGPD